MMVFQNVEGNIVAKAYRGEEPDKFVSMQAALLANLTHEYIDFGTEAFQDNKLQNIVV